MVLLSLIVTAFSIYMNPDSRMFTDDSGRSLIFHGFNVVFKIPPYIPITDHFDPQLSLSSEDIDNLVKWGFNFIRLGVMWEAVERTPGVYNTTYLQEVDSLIRSLGKAGIWTLVDAHQDVFARSICGEGVPNFYAQNLEDSCSYFGLIAELFGACKPLSSFNLGTDENGNPEITDCLKNPFASYYETPEAMEAFERLYKNVDGLQDKFAAYWDVTSKFFVDNPYVVGYDIINEPLMANLFTEPWLFFPGVFDRTVLQPLYQRMHKVIRQNDEEKIIFFEPDEADELPFFGGIIFNAGFTETPGGPEYNKAQILNDHSYCCAASPSMCNGGEPPLSAAAECREYNMDKITKRSKNAKDLGVGLIISEFGACLDSESCVEEINGVADACDANLVGWAYWMFKGYADFTTTGSYTEGLWTKDGSFEEEKLKALSRTYIEAYQGVPVSASFDTDSGEFNSVFKIGVETAPTVLYLNREVFYPNGYSLDLVHSEGKIADVVEKGNYVEISFPAGEAEVSVKVTAK